MDCPVCSILMKEEDFGGVKVDVCSDGCKGIWFDWCELIKLDETHEGLGKALNEALENDRVAEETGRRIACPKCNIPMVAHLYQGAKAVTVDECYGCGGFFLDSGELQAIRENFMNDQEREKFVSQMLSNDAAFKNEKENLQKIRERTEAVRKACRVITGIVPQGLRSGIKDQIDKQIRNS